MMIHEAGAVKALNAAYKKGYEIAPMKDGRIGIYTEYWALEIPMRDLPLKVSQTLVEHLGHLPVAAEFCQKGRNNQMMMESEITDRRETLDREKSEARNMRPIPLRFKGRWQLFVSAEGAIAGYDEEYLGVMDLEKCSPAYLMQENGYAEFSEPGCRMVISAGAFGPEDRKRLWQIAKLYETVSLGASEPAENLCLFDDMEREG